MPHPQQAQTWTRDQYIISTNKSLLDLSAINNVFDEDWMYWTTPLPSEVLQQIIDSSFCFGLYTTTSTTKQTQIGFARLITDNITFAYITDLYVLPGYQGSGLGGWLLDCIDEWLEGKEYLRWAMLRTSRSRSKEAYGKRLGMQVLENGTGDVGPWMMGKKGKAARA